MRERRRIMKAVNRGKALDDRRDALLAVNVARQQQRFWKWAWLMGPAVSVLFFDQGWQAVLANALVATLILGGMSAFWYLRARRSEHANLEAVGLAPSPSAAAHDADEEDEADDAPDRAGTPHAANPPKRSRSRRRRG